MDNSFTRQLAQLDRVLRGDATRSSALKAGNIEISIRGMSVTILVLAMLYGVCMGCFSLFRSDGSLLQVIASTVKVPLLFFLTLIVTFPSLYVFNALVGSRLTALAMLRLLTAALAVNLAVLSSLGPIVAFFSVSTTSYAFMVLLNVLVFAVSGGLGLLFLLQTLNRLTFAEAPPLTRVDSFVPEEAQEQQTADPENIKAVGMSVTDAIAPSPPESNLTTRLDTAEFAPRQRESELGALDSPVGQVLGQHVKKVFITWMIVFGLVGAQMGWVLRPFIGSPDQSFEWFRDRQSNFFEAVLRAFGNLFW